MEKHHASVLVEMVISNEKTPIKDIPAEKLDFAVDMAVREFEYQDRCRTAIRGRVQTLLLVLVSAVSAICLYFLKYPDTKTGLVLTLPFLLWIGVCLRLYPLVMSAGMTDPYGDIRENLFGNESINWFKRRQIHHLCVSADELSKKTVSTAKAFNDCLMVSVLGAAVLVVSVLAAGCPWQI